ncbi:hypothetical protein OEZ85_000808 [Tetradesmus obliquus]|uniref:tRNA/rRNA methyltransferase SpoU type domain-containing protein n=1 Tax=Tetradesmus obliquus TaxID=3088 RepID=A0ABY8UJG3_TETOB|nr:hypothetical protein OEZ85_000808 [Tetradesmus obliquus]
MELPPEKQEAVNNKIANALANRVDRILLVLECCADNKNYLACLRTCDILGVQNVWIIEAPLPVRGGSKQQQQQQQQQPQQQQGLQQHQQQQQQQQSSSKTLANGSSSSGLQHKGPDKRLTVEQGKKKGRIARASTQWLDVRVFTSTAAAVWELKAGGWAIWATDLNPGAVSLLDPSLEVPQQLAIVMGSEAAGVSQEMRQAADRCVYLPMYGFTESLNVSVATALVLQTLIARQPAVRGQLLGEGRAAQLEAKWRAAAARAPECQAGALHVKQQPQEQQLDEQLVHSEGVQGNGS